MMYGIRTLGSLAGISFVFLVTKIQLLTCAVAQTIASGSLIRFDWQIITEHSATFLSRAIKLKPVRKDSVPALVSGVVPTTNSIHVITLMAGST